MKKFLSAVAIVVALHGTAQAQEYSKGNDAYQAGDYATALEEWRPLAEQGDVIAQLGLALMYANGHGVLQDHAEAVRWYRLGAEQGFAPAQFNLGLSYYIGQGVLQDYTEAVRWYRLAAAQGLAHAQASLGDMHYHGRGVLKDFVVAHMWYNIASANGHENAPELRDAIAVLSPPQDISTAQAMARECMSSNYQNCGY